MGKWAIQYRKSPGDHGSFVIEETGLCLRADVFGIETGVLTRFKLIPFPNASGFLLKILDGSTPGIVQVKPSTADATYQCVKIGALVNPFAAAQDGGPLQGQTVLTYVIRWQTLGVAA